MELVFALPLVLVDMSGKTSAGTAARTLAKGTIRNVWLAASTHGISPPVVSEARVLWRWDSSENRVVCRLRDIDLSSHTHDVHRASAFLALPPDLAAAYAAMETDKIRTDFVVEIMRCTFTTALEGAGGTLYFPLRLPYLSVTIAETAAGNVISLAERRPYAAEPSPALESVVDALNAANATIAVIQAAALELEARAEHLAGANERLLEHVQLYEMERKIMQSRLARLQAALDQANAAATRRAAALAASRPRLAPVEVVESAPAAGARTPVYGAAAEQQ